jgi:hypothetical protein
MEMIHHQQRYVPLQAIKVLHTAYRLQATAPSQEDPYPQHVLSEKKQCRLCRLGVPMPVTCPCNNLNPPDLVPRRRAYPFRCVRYLRMMMPFEKWFR